MLNLALCIPTFNRSECVRDFLEQCASYYVEAGIDIYIYDSSTNDDTAMVVKQFTALWSEKIFYIRMSSEISVGMKLYSIYRQLEWKKNYDFMWMCGDALKYTKDTIKRLCSNLKMDYDVVMLNTNDKENKGTKIFTDRNEFLRDCAWGVALLGASILNVKTMLENVDWDNYKKRSLQEDIIIFLHVSHIYNSLAQKAEPKVLHLSCRGSDIRYSIYKKACGWHSNTFSVLCDSWVRTIEELSSCYSKEAKDRAILLHGKYTMLASDKDMYVLRREGLYNFKVFLKYLFTWNRVCEISIWKLFYISLMPKAMLQRTEERKKKKEYDAFNKFYNQYSETVIYGAGSVGYAYAKFLEKEGKALRGFCVSSKSGKKDSYLGYPVYAIDDVAEELKDTGIIIALQHQNEVQEVLSLLREKGLDNNSYSSRTFHEIIRYELGYR